MAVIGVKYFVTAVLFQYTSIRQTPIFPKDVDKNQESDEEDEELKKLEKLDKIERENSED